jgi:hypothetical protein
MDLDAALIAKVLGEKDALKRARQMGLDETLLIGPPRDALLFIEKYKRKYGELPGPEVVAQETGCAIRPVEVTLEYVIEELFNRGKFHVLKRGGREMVGLLENGTPRDVEQLVMRMHDDLHRLKAKKTQAVSMASLGDIVWQRYLDMKEGRIGVPLPWPKMTAMTMGLWAKTLTFFVGRPASGKTYTGVLVAMHAWMQGLKVLVVSPEMPKEEIAERFFSMYSKVAYPQVVSGRLPTFAEQHLRSTIDTIREMEGFWVIDAEERLSVSEIEEAVDTLRPDLLLLDSVYMLDSGAKGDRSEKAIAVAEWASRFCKKAKDGEGIPIVGISQLARPGDKKGSVANSAAAQNQVENLRNQLALSDQFLWYVNNLFAIVQDDDMRADKMLEYVPLKLRRSVFRQNVKVRWDMDEMDFSEIGASTDAFVDDDFDKGQRGI